MKFVGCSLALFLSISLFAQFPYPKEDLALLVEQRPLAVQLLPESTQVEKELNQVLKEAFETHWTLGEVEFFSLKKFTKLKKENPQKYAFLGQRSDLNEDLLYGIEYVDGSMAGRIKGASTQADEMSIREFEQYAIEKVNLEYYDFTLNVFEGRKEKFVTTVSFINSDLAKHDYIFMCQQLQLLVSSSASGLHEHNFQDAKVNLDTLAGLTAYFLDDFLEEDIIQNFENYYDYPHKIVSYQDYVRVINAAASGTAYIKMMFAWQQNKYMWGIVDASNGRILSLSEFAGTKFTGSYDADKMIKPSYLRAATRVNAQMISNPYTK